MAHPPARLPIDCVPSVLLASKPAKHSDSPGNLLGLIHGVAGIREEWRRRPELRDVVERVAPGPLEPLRAGRAAAVSEPGGLSAPPEANVKMGRPVEPR